jgi:uncharacterized membrane protein
VIISQYFIAFIVFSFIGWIYECIYCTIMEKHWQNRGFLFGPICPIYGVCVVLAIIVFGQLHIPGVSYETPVWKLFIICALMSAVIEYLTSYVLERIFHAVWWDYSNIIFNINGRICLPATCGFGIAGVLIVKYIFPMITSMSWSAHPLLNELIALLFMLLLGVDLSLTVASLTNMLSRMESMQLEFDKRMQSGYEKASSAPATIVTAAKNSASSAVNAGKVLSEIATGYVKNLPVGHIHHLRNIRGFRSENTKKITTRISSAIKELGPGRRRKQKEKEESA